MIHEILLSTHIRYYFFTANSLLLLYFAINILLTIALMVANFSLYRLGYLVRPHNHRIDNSCKFKLILSAWLMAVESLDKWIRL